MKRRKTLRRIVLGASLIAILASNSYSGNFTNKSFKRVVEIGKDFYNYACDTSLDPMTYIPAALIYFSLIKRTERKMKQREENHS